MKRSKRLYLLLGVLLLACLMTFAVSRMEEKKEVIKSSGEIILSLPADSVRALSWKYNGESFRFHRDEIWLYDEDEAFPVDEKRVRALLEQFEEFRASFIIEEVEDFGQYGLDNPVCTIQVETEDKTCEILLGDYSTMDSERYVSIGDGNVYLAKTDPLDYFDITLSDMIDHDEIPEFDKVSGIQFAGAENYSIIYEENSSHTYCPGDVYFMKEDGAYLPMDTDNVERYLKAVHSLELTDYVTYNVSGEELSAYGLDAPELTVSIQYTESSDIFTLSVSRDPEERAAAREASSQEGGNEDEEITAYVRVGESQIIYRITSEEYRALMDASYNTLRHQEVLSADFADIYQIDIRLEEKDYTITSEEKANGRTYYYGEEELDIEGLQNGLTALKADSFTDEQPSQKEEIRLTVYLDNEAYPEISIELYRYDGSHCLAVVDETPVSLVKRSEVVDLIEAVNAIVLN